MASESAFEPDAKFDFDVDLEPVNEGQGQLRSDASIQFFQTQASNRRISGRIVHAIHGFLDGETGTDATHASLIVLRFRLTSKNESGEKRRWKRFYCPLRFQTDPESEPIHDPWVRAYAPAQNGTIYLSETLAKNTNSRTYKVAANTKAPPPVDIGAEVSAERTRQQESEERYLHTVEADREKTDTEGGGRQGEDIVYWNLRENKKEKVGVADEIQVAILLVRPKKEQNFVMHYHPEAKIDVYYQTQDRWQEIRGKKTTILHFDVSQGINVPTGLDVTKLGEVMANDDEELNKLAYIHIPEKFLPRQTYHNGCQIREGDSVAATANSS